MSADGVFVAGTDTGVGKTVVTAGIARTLELKDQDVGAVKPAQTGCFREGNDWVAPDARFVRSVLEDGEVYCPFRYEPPLAPTVADEVSEELDGKSLSYDSVLENVRRAVGRHDVAVVEGIGGVRVPLADDGEVIDLAVELGFPVVVVSRPSLGTLNHTALTVEALERRGAEVVGVVLNRYPDEPNTAERTNPRIIEEMTGVDVLGRIPSVPELDVDDANPSDFVDVFRRRVDVSRILDSVVD